MRTLEHFPNLVAMFFARAREKGDAPFLWAKRDGQWRATSWAEAARQVASLATALRALGIKRGDRVMLVSENRPEWCISDLAIMAAGCVTVPTYITNTERDHQHILENSGACAVIVSTAKLAKTLMPAVLKSNQGQLIIGIDEMRFPPLSSTMTGGADRPIIPADAGRHRRGFRARGPGVHHLYLGAPAARRAA
jgi:long-chain acyl-CoA synthetase